MKTIQIPTTSNPFIVNINNNAYQYRAGETAEVPDEVAEAIEDALELEPKPKRYLGQLAQFVEGLTREIPKSDLEGITTVSPCAFYNYDSLTEIALPDTVTHIGYSAFGNCNGLATITMGSKVTSIGSNAFEYCTALTSIEMPNSISNIGSYAFRNCTGLKKVVMRPTTPPDIKEDTFANVPTTCVFEVPADALGVYKTAPCWSAFANQIVAIKE